MSEIQPTTGGTLPATAVATENTTGATPAKSDKPAGIPTKGHRANGLGSVFLPNQIVSPTVMRGLILLQVLFALAIWSVSASPVLPRPLEVLDALKNLWMTQGLGPELWVSFRLTLEALFWTALISIGLSYLTVMPFFRPIVTAISKGRFLSLVGFSLIFTLMVGGGHTLKLYMLVFGMTVFFITSMASVVANIPREKFDYARTLRMSEWRVVWEVVILGTLAEAFEVMRQNAAMGWTLLTFVEGIVRSEGGVGALLLAQEKHFRIADVFAIQLVILLLGLFIDFAIGMIRSTVCPYADLKLERQERQ